jgi:hypothetical protein
MPDMGMGALSRGEGDKAEEKVGLPVPSDFVLGPLSLRCVACAVQEIQYLELEATEGHMKSHADGSKQTKIVVCWEAKQLSSPCTIM